MRDCNESGAFGGISMNARLGFIGAGNMAGAIIEGVTGAKLMAPEEIGVFDIDGEKLKSYEGRGFKTFCGIKELVAACDAVLIAVKPQSFLEVLPQIKAGMSPEKLLISIAAGITSEAIKSGLGFDCKLILAMPNTPLMLGCGATALSVQPPADDSDYKFAESIFASAGIAVKIPADKMKEIIPVNGSSPAFFYYLVKLIADEAEKAGIPAEAAYPLVCQTMLGSARMLLESGKTPQQLIDMVCSPGGTTLAGMKALDDNGFGRAVEAASKACVNRAYELSEANNKPQEQVKPEVENKQEQTQSEANNLQEQAHPEVVTQPEAGNQQEQAKPQSDDTGEPTKKVIATKMESQGDWHSKAVFYQIYTLGFCGAPEHNDGVEQNRINKVADWIPHLANTGVDAVYFGPVFESDSHGYDTRDYSRIDCRLGNNNDFALVCSKLHEKGIRVVLDGVFNHVGRGFWAFEDVRQNRHNSQYKDWFHIDFNGNSNYNDSFWYEGWEGHYELVKLNLNNQQVREHIFGCVGGWIEQFGIDGLRLDVAYMLNEDFMRALRTYVKSWNPDFFLIGEAIHGDYNRIVNDSMLDSCTNYECYKGIYSSFNDRNMFEIAHSLSRQFGPEHWTSYKGKHLFNFVDNHDVSRIASILKDERHLSPVYGLLFGIPGIPCVYYGSEWGEKAEKSKGSDANLRPCFDAPSENGLTSWISSLARIHKENPAFAHGNYRQLYLTNSQFVFAREMDGNRVVVAINAGAEPHTTGVLPTSGRLFDLMSGEYIEFSGTIELASNSAAFYRCD